MKIRKSVGAFLFNNEGKILLVKHYRGREYYNIPKGGIEEGETYLEALRRELMEELGIDNFGEIRDLGMDFTFEFSEHLKKENGFGYQNVKMFSVEFLGKDEDIKIDNKEIVEAIFVSVEEFLEKIPFENTKEVFRKFMEMK